MMADLLSSRLVLAVRDLRASTEFYTDVLGFTQDVADESGVWSFLSRANFKVMLGECPNDPPASDLGCHSYVAYVTVDGVDALYEELAGRGAEIISIPTTESWGMREFAIRTPDGHRIRFGEPAVRASR